MYAYPAALDAMQKVASGLFKGAGRPMRVEVIPDASNGTASVTWEKHPAACTIRMPVLPASRKMTQAEFDDYAGYILHETGHPLYTDQNVWHEAVRAGQANLLNSLEDVRIEKALIDNCVAKNAKAVLSALVRSLDYSCGRDSFDANDSKNIGFVMGFLGRAANGYDMDASIVSRKLDPQGRVSKVLKWALPELAACNSTKDCYALARRIVAALPAPKDKQPPKGNKSPAGQAGEGKPGEGKPAEGKPGEGKPGEGKPAEGKPGEGKPAEGKPAEGKQAGQGAGQGAGEETGQLSDSDVAKVDLRPVLKGEIPQGSQKANIMTMVIGAVRTAGGGKVPDIHAGGLEADQSIADNAAKATRQRALLAKALKANDRDTFDGGLKHGRLNPRAFAKVAAGQTNVFGKRELIEGYETDVVVLVDGSGSMSNGKIGRAATFALVVAQAAAQVGVSCETYLFGASGGTGKGHLLKVKDGKGRPDAAKFAAMPAHTGGSTPLTQAMLRAAVEQAARAPAKRKVMFIVSDGGCNMGSLVVKQAATYVETVMGIELANLFIGDQLLGCFRNEVLVNPAHDVASVGLGQFVKVLEQGGAV